VVDEEPDQEPAEGGRSQHLPPRQLGRTRRHLLGGVAVEEILKAAGQQSEGERAVAGCGADRDREDEQQQLIVAGDPLPGLDQSGHESFKVLRTTLEPRRP
jgi:hypothetical protein